MPQAIEEPLKGRAMTKRLYIDQIREGQLVEDVFLVLDKAVNTSLKGAKYISVVLGDRTGHIKASIWDRVDELGRNFSTDDFVRVVARAKLYQDRLQLTLSDITRVPEEEIDPRDFVTRSPEDPEKMLNRIRTILDRVQDKYLRALAALYLKDKEFMRLFRSAPAAKRMHHVYLGGLMKHTLSVMELVELVAPKYKEVNIDLLRVGAFIHDSGKVKELAFSRKFDYTNEGRLIGHLSMGLEMLSRKIDQIDGFPSDLALHLKHIIISHHGSYQFGSPKRPKTLEALLLYHLDDLDAKMSGISQFMAASEDQDSDWTKYHEIYEQFFFKRRYQSKPPEREEEPPAGKGRQEGVLPSLFDVSDDDDNEETIS